MRQYLYISKTKVDGLEAGLRRKRRPQVTLTASAFGLSLATTSPTETTNLYRRTNALIKRMEQRKELATVPDHGDLGQSRYYHDDAEWAYGLFAFKCDFSLKQADAHVITYLLWRRWRDSIILLAGSPMNILGEQVVREGVWAYGTTGTLATLFEFTDSVLRTDEENLIGLAPPGDRPNVAGLLWIEGGTGWPAADPPEQILQPEILSSPRGLALAALCLGHLSILPTGRIETAFRVTHSIEVNLRGNVPRWATDLLSKGNGRDKLYFLRQCRKIYVGSPLFTALPLYLGIIGG